MTELAREGARPVGSVIRAAEFTAWTEAEAVLQTAQRRAREIAEAATHDAAAERLRAASEAKQDGAAEVVAAVAAASEKAARFVTSLEAELPGIVTAVVRSIFGTFDRQELVAGAVRTALQDYRTTSGLVLQSHPDDADGIRRVLADIGSVGGMIGPDLEIDAAFPPGRVLLTGSFGAVDLSVETQLKALEYGLKAGWTR